MAKRKRKPSKNTYDRRIKEGRGQGKLDEYKPWLRIHDVSSKGLSTRIRGIKTNRVHHLLSRLKLYLFYQLDWSESVIDIQEQFPLLPQYETLAIAKSLGVRHPQVRIPIKKQSPKNGLGTGNARSNPRTEVVPIVMTTDFRVTVRVNSSETRVIAVNVKYAKDLEKSRTREKLEIERGYWRRRKIELINFTEQNADKTFVKNIEWVHSYFKPDWLECLGGISLEKVSEHLLNLLLTHQIPLGKATAQTDEFFNFELGVSLMFVRHFIASRKWRVDMTAAIEPGKTLVFIGNHKEAL